ncbi:MAG TPA: CoA-transferase [Terriglobales bacterium]|nr:CoA-transferase [Terriglobales bacterium]
MPKNNEYSLEPAQISALGPTDDPSNSTTTILSGQASRYGLNLREKRRKIEEKTKSPQSKIMALSEAVEQFVKVGCHVAIGGCLYSRTPTAAIHEIIRQKIGNLEVSRSLTGMEADLLLGAGLLRKVVTSWWSVGYAWGISKAMRSAVEQQLVAFEEWSHLALGLRYRAAAMGTSFLPTLSMLGSDLEKTNGLRTMTCPYSSEKMLLVPALYPDVGLIHAQMADKAGNVHIDGYEFMDQDITRASERVIVTVERIVDSKTFRKQPDLTTIPFFCVDAIVKVPNGSYPSECWGLYEADFDHFAKFADRITTKGIAGSKEYNDEFVYGTASFRNFLAKIGQRRLAKLRGNMRNVLK